MIIRKIFTIVFIVVMCVGCTSQILPEDLLPDDDVNVDLELEFEDDQFNSYHELLLSYVFIDVINLNQITLPSRILNEEISWIDNDTEVKILKGNNITYYLKAYIGNQYKNFNITFTNGVVTHIYQQDLKFYYHFISNPIKLGTSMSPSKIIIHNTANTAPALNEVLYLNSSSNTSSTSFHFAVDDIGIYQAVPTNIYAHHAGELATNKQSIGIEIAKSLLSDNTIKDKAIYNAQRLIRLLQMQHNIDELLTHYDVTSKWCPHDILDRYGIDRFYNELNNLYTII